MKTVVKQRWVGPEMYVEVAYTPRNGRVDVRVFRRDPRKAQYHKVKYWNRGLWIPSQSISQVLTLLRSGAVGRNVDVKTAEKIIREDLGLTSSDRRAVAS